MNRQQLEKAYLTEWAKHENQNSKWFAQDLADAAQHIKTRSNEQLENSLSNLRAMSNPNSAFNREVDREIERMDKAGLFNIRNLSPNHALD